MSSKPLKETDILNNLYGENSHASDFDLKKIADFFGVNAGLVASAVGMSESALSKNPYSNKKPVKQWQSIFNLLIEIITDAEPQLSNEEVRVKMQRWLKLSRPEFQDKTPVDMLLSGKAKKVKNLLEQLV